MPVPVVNRRVSRLVHLMYLVKSGWPQPNPVPNGNLTGIVPHVSRHVLLMMEEAVWMGGVSKRRMVDRSKVSEEDGIVKC